MAFGIDDAIAAGLRILDKFIPDPAQKAKAEAELRASLLEWDKAQTDINKVEAASSNLFVSGWRPSIGWICSAALAYQYLFIPFAMWICILTDTVIPKPPVLDDTLWELMFGLLGLGGLRTLEKIKKVAS